MMERAKMDKNQEKQFSSGFFPVKYGKMLKIDENETKNDKKGLNGWKIKKKTISGFCEGKYGKMSKEVKKMMKKSQMMMKKDKMDEKSRK
jgi:hypothetical protein